MNYDIPATAQATRSFYAAFGNRAQVDTTGEVEPHLIAKHLISHGVPLELDFLKVDIDSFECEYLEALLLGGFKPKVIDIEVGASYPPPIKFRARYTAGSGVSLSAAKLSATPFSGCSLQEVMDLVKPFHYTLLQFPMEDAWLVKDEFAHLFGPLAGDNLDAIFRQGNPQFYGAWQLFPGQGLNVVSAHQARASPEVMFEKMKLGHEAVLNQRRDLRDVAQFSFSVAGHNCAYKKETGYNCAY